MPTRPDGRNVHRTDAEDDGKPAEVMRRSYLAFKANQPADHQQRCNQKDWSGFDRARSLHELPGTPKIKFPRPATRHHLKGRQQTCNRW